MAFLGLPDLDKTFCNFEHGLDAENVSVSEISHDAYHLLQDALSNDNDSDHIQSNLSESPSTTLPPNIDYPLSNNNDTDEDIDITPNNMKALRDKEARLRRKRQRATNRNLTNNPNPFSKTHKPTAEQYANKYKKCPWKQINIQRAKLSYDIYSVAP